MIVWHLAFGAHGHGNASYDDAADASVMARDDDGNVPAANAAGSANMTGTNASGSRANAGSGGTNANGSVSASDDGDGRYVSLSASPESGTLVTGTIGDATMDDHIEWSIALIASCAGNPDNQRQAAGDTCGFATTDEVASAADSMIGKTADSNLVLRYRQWKASDIVPGVSGRVVERIAMGSPVEADGTLRHYVADATCVDTADNGKEMRHVIRYESYVDGTSGTILSMTEDER